MTVIAAVLAACQPQSSPAPTSAPAETPAATPVDMHTSRNSIDWIGTFEGLLPCSDCAGVLMRVTLHEKGSFALEERRVDAAFAQIASQGEVVWEAGDNTISLGTQAGVRRFAVGEGGLQLLQGDQTRGEWSQTGTILTRSPFTGSEEPLTVAQVLVNHRWTLVDARDASNQRVAALFPSPDRTFRVSFSADALHAEGGCNGVRAGYTLDESGSLSLTAGASTMMACDAALMEADAALARALQSPLQTATSGGMEPALALRAPDGSVLVLRGELTHEARLGEATRVFLEVDSQTVACEGGARGDGQCLRAREITFDDQGIKVGEPSEWSAFPNAIEGYEHKPGIRNVLRLKRFAPGAGAPEGAYVLDLVVESEVVEPAAG
jgi:heat shock protein HslJ